MQTAELRYRPACRREHENPLFKQVSILNDTATSSPNKKTREYALF